MAEKLQLIFKKYSNATGGRWMKKIDSKVVYFGSAKAKRDRNAYKKALEKFRRFMVEREERQVLKVKIEKKQKEFVETGRAPEYAAWALSIEEAHEQGEVQRQQAVIGEAKRLVSGQSIISQRPSLPRLIDVYLAEQCRRHEITKQQPESLPAKRRLGVSANRSIKDQLKSFKIWVERNRETLGNESLQTETMLRRYRACLDDLMLAKKLSPATISNRVRGLKRFIEWLWQRRYIAEMPRGLDEICAKYTYKSTAKSLTVKQIRSLWKNADYRMKAIIIVCLNCGMYPREAGLLVGSDLRDGYIAARRPKTGVPGKWKLWDITRILIEKTRNNKGKKELLWQTRTGRPLINDAPNSRNDALHKPWKKLCKESKVKATPSQLRDTASTFVEGIGKREGMPSLVSQLLRHADQRTARWYIDQNINPHELETKKLDEALGEFEVYLGLGLERK